MIKEGEEEEEEEQKVSAMSRRRRVSGRERESDVLRRVHARMYLISNWKE